MESGRVCCQEIKHGGPMTCKHEWTHNGFDFEDGANCKHCPAWLNTDEIERRLNENEKLRELIGECGACFGLTADRHVEHERLMRRCDDALKVGDDDVPS